MGVNSAGNADVLVGVRVMGRARASIAGRATQLLLVLAFVAVAFISLVGIGASAVIVETVQGSGSAVNAAGGLRRLAHRAASVALAAALEGRTGHAEVAAAIGAFEAGLGHATLEKVLEHEPGSVFASVYRSIHADWYVNLRPRLLGAPELASESPDVLFYEDLLADVDAFTAQIDALVAVLEQETETGIEQLRMTLAVALGMVMVVMVAALCVIRQRVFMPLTELRDCAARIAGGDFRARSRYTGRDELGRVGSAFNAMADELSTAYRDLEQRVEQKTADLMRSNRALELLYHVIARLYHAPASPETYAETLKDLEQVLGLKGSFVCVQPKHGGVATVLSTTMGDCPARSRSEEECTHCPGRTMPWSYRREGDLDVFLVPLRDADHLYGMMRLALPPGERLRAWQHTLVEAVSRHMGIALGISHQSERERLLALQEERSIIARELHDSLAQSLSYMKIQASLLSSALQRPERRDDASDILADMKGGINAAYRQLRELLSTFRLQMEGDFARLLGSTVEEYAGRSGMPIDLEIRLGVCHLNPNQEIHVLHIIREALSNATRHARASSIRVGLFGHPDGVRVIIEDDGKGIRLAAATEPHHYGLAIMAERARGLGGVLEIVPRPDGGTRVAVRFDPAARHEASSPALTPDAQ